MQASDFRLNTTAFYTQRRGGMALWLQDDLRPILSAWHSRVKHVHNNGSVRGHQVAHDVAYWHRRTRRDKLYTDVTTGTCTLQGRRKCTQRNVLLACHRGIVAFASGNNLGVRIREYFSTFDRKILKGNFDYRWKVLLVLTLMFEYVPQMFLKYLHSFLKI